MNTHREIERYLSAAIFNLIHFLRDFAWTPIGILSFAKQNNSCYLSWHNLFSCRCGLHNLVRTRELWRKAVVKWKIRTYRCVPKGRHFECSDNFNFNCHCIAIIECEKRPGIRIVLGFSWWMCHCRTLLHYRYCNLNIVLVPTQSLEMRAFCFNWTFFFYLRIQEKERKTQTSVQFTTASNNIYYCNSSIEQSKKTINLRSYHLCALFLCALDFINSFSERGKNAQHTECIVLCKSTKCSNRVSYFCQLRSIYLFMMTKMNAKGNSRPIQHTQSITS